ncbi:hypothetical protein MES4922_90090 [Mesorhizobium ventifaucium]|uniref:Uncharacterized protein n=1 Tax=Mesorhizobium ventifaucium TaxID=666020 RepID=A0ABN8KD30_9HYPH|nr:hypothetical protein MES4922_90090 [Mesorhizobium ventifaucium]
MKLQPVLDPRPGLGNPALVAAIKCPLLDAFAAQKAGLGQHPHVLAERRLGDPQLFRNQQRADPVLDQIAIRLAWEMRARVLQPIEDLQPALVGDRLEDINLLHLAILLSY